MIKLITNELYKNLKKKKIVIVIILLAISTFFGCYNTYNDFKIKTPEVLLSSASKYLDYLKTQEKLTTISESEKKDYATKIENQINFINNYKKTSMYTDEEMKKNLQNEIIELKNKVSTSDITNMGSIKELNFEIQLDKYYLKHNLNPNDENKITAINMIFEVITFINVIFLPFIILMLVADTVSGELSPPTIKMLLTKPISRQKVLLSKFAASIISIAGLVFLFQAIAFFALGIIFKFGSLASPTIINTKYINDPEKLAQNIKGVIAVAGSSVIIPFWKAIIIVLLMQLLFVFACASFCILISVLSKKSNISIGLGFLIMTILTMLNINFSLSNSTASSISIVDKILPYLFTTYSDGNSLITGSLTSNIGNPSITSVVGISVLIIWSVVCYGIAHIVFKHSDVLA